MKALVNPIGRPSRNPTTCNFITLRPGLAARDGKQVPHHDEPADRDDCANDGKRDA
jgi:hypothetical protein